MEDAYLDSYWEDQFDSESQYYQSDLDHDMYVLTSAGWGTDEDYGYYGEEDYDYY